MAQGGTDDAPAFPYWIKVGGPDGHIYLFQRFSPDPLQDVSPAENIMRNALEVMRWTVAEQAAWARLQAQGESPVDEA
jgi:hypothetical protein